MKLLTLLAMSLAGCASYESMAISQFETSYQCPSDRDSAQLTDAGIVVSGCGKQARYSCTESSRGGVGRRGTSSTESECHEVPLANQ